MKLSMEVIKTGADLHLLEDGKVSSLVLKEWLREIGFNTTQQEVSERLEAYMEVFFPYEIDDVTYVVDVYYQTDSDTGKKYKEWFFIEKDVFDQRNENGRSRYVSIPYLYLPRLK